MFIDQVWIFSKSICSGPQCQCTQWTVHLSSNFNSCLCEGLGKTLRKDDIAATAIWGSTMNYLSMSFLMGISCDPVAIAALAVLL